MNLPNIEHKTNDIITVEHLTMIDRINDANIVQADCGMLIFSGDIKQIDMSEMENGTILIQTRGGAEYTVSDFQMIDYLYRLKPNVFEGKRMKYAKHAWAYHNLVAHPLMQILAFFGKYKLAMEVHDATIPKPIGHKNKC